jgi:hypothetical protein
MRYIKTITLTRNNPGLDVLNTSASKRAIESSYVAVRAIWPDTLPGDPLKLMITARGAPVWVRLLFAVLREVRELSVASNDDRWAERYMNKVFNPTGFHSSQATYSRLSTLCQRSLETLSVTMKERGYLRGTFLQLRRMNNLKTVVISCGFLEPLWKFPPCLQTLRVYCGETILPRLFLDETLTMKATGAGLHHLRQVQIFFKTSCRSFAIFLVQNKSQIFRRRAWAELLAELHKLDLSFETYFLDRDEPVKARFDTRQYKRECLLKEMVLVGKGPRKKKT